MDNKYVSAKLKELDQRTAALESKAASYSSEEIIQMLGNELRRIEQYGRKQPPV